LDSKEPEVVHGYDMRTRRSRTLADHNPPITEKDKKKRSVMVETEKPDDNQ
jgi:hypothetical protein